MIYNFILDLRQIFVRMYLEKLQTNNIFLKCRYF